MLAPVARYSVASMITDDDVNLATLSTRRQLAGWRADVARGMSPSETAQKVALSIDVLRSVRAEAGPQKWGVIDRLIDELQTFLQELSH